MLPVAMVVVRKNLQANSNQRLRDVDMRTMSEGRQGLAVHQHQVAAVQFPSLLVHRGVMGLLRQLSECRHSENNRVMMMITMMMVIIKLMAVVIIMISI